jgi:hypothetical protein
LIRWRSELRNGFIYKVNDKLVQSIDDVKLEIAMSRESNQPEIQIQFALIDTVAIHAEKGLPQLFFDQLNLVSKHLFELQHDPAYNEQFTTILGHEHPPDDEFTHENSKILKNLHNLIAHKIDSTDLAKK